MEIKKIKIDGTKLLINDDTINNCSVKGFRVENDYAEDELAEVTITLLAPRTDVIISGILSDEVL